MNKAIILLSGSPTGKTKFIEKAKESSWLWNRNYREFLGSKANGMGWDGERNEEYYNFTLEFLNLVNKYFKAEEKYLRDKIEKFLSDTSERKVLEDGKVFESFLLIVHGVSKDLTEVLKSDYGVFKVHISRRDLNSSIELHDLVLYEDDENFTEEVNRVVKVLTNNRKDT